MALYLVLHHQKDKNQTWVNAWSSDELIQAIQTTSEIGSLCRRAKERGERVFVHRCGWDEHPPVICCSAGVEEVGAIDKATAFVRFASAAQLNASPLRVPVRGQSFYLA